jgi:hypothetical protein
LLLSVGAQEADSEAGAPAGAPTGSYAILTKEGSAAIRIDVLQAVGASRLPLAELAAEQQLSLVGTPILPKAAEALTALKSNHILVKVTYLTAVRALKDLRYTLRSPPRLQLALSAGEVECNLDGAYAALCKVTTVGSHLAASARTRAHIRCAHSRELMRTVRAPAVACRRVPPCASLCRA